MNRRRFLKTAGGALALGPAATATAAEPDVAPGARASAGADQIASVRVEDNRVFAITSTLTATLENGHLISLKNRVTGEEYVTQPDASGSPALELVYRADAVVPVDASKFGSITAHPVSPDRAEFVFHGWDGDGVLTVAADAATGDLLLEPSAYSSRPGVRACRWNVVGLGADLRLVAPFFQGVRLPLADPLMRNSHWEWPFQWEAGLAILEANRGGFWVHTRDSRYRYKALQVGAAGEANRLGFETEAYGPVHASLGAGGLTWRINVFDGDWRGPAEAYRAWLWEAYNLRREEERRRSWIFDTRLALCWCPGRKEILEALAERIEPGRVLIHYPNWRTDAYDENYPEYNASQDARAFIAEGQRLGFRMMPHFNAIDMDPSHPSYALLRDFQYRGIDRQDLRGWSWYQGRGLGVPESNASRRNNRDKKVMVKIHPGLAMWRSLLGRRISGAAEELALDTVFIDVTLVSHNLDNCLVEGMTSTEGMHRLIRHVAELRDGLVVGGEGLNEITMQNQSFAQAHLFRSWQSSTEGLERTGGCDLNQLLFGRLCRTIGYSGLGGRNQDEELRMRIHEEHGAIPTLTIRSAADITRPNPAVRRALDRATG